MHRLALVLAIVSVGCEKNNKAPPPTSGAPNQPRESGPAGGKTAAIPQEAEELFQNKCAMCHGPDGKGNGPGASALRVKPRNYTDPAWQASVTDDAIRQIILRGGQSVGKSAEMPGNPDLSDQPAIVDGLVKIIRRFGKK